MIAGKKNYFKYIKNRSSSNFIHMYCENFKSFGRFNQVENQRTVKILTKDLLNQHVLLHLFNIDNCRSHT